MIIRVCLTSNVGSNSDLLFVLFLYLSLSQSSTRCFGAALENQRGLSGCIFQERFVDLVPCLSSFHRSRHLCLVYIFAYSRQIFSFFGQILSFNIIFSTFLLWRFTKTHNFCHPLLSFDKLLSINFHWFLLIFNCLYRYLFNA